MQDVLTFFLSRPLKMIKNFVFQCVLAFCPGTKKMRSFLYRPLKIMRIFMFGCFNYFFVPNIKNK